MSKKVKQKENRRVTGRRTFLLGSGMLLAMSFLSGRLYQLQVAQNNRYKRLSDRNQFDWRVVPPRRGRLVDRQERLRTIPLGGLETYQASGGGWRSAAGVGSPLLCTPRAAGRPAARRCGARRARSPP